MKMTILIDMNNDAFILPGPEHETQRLLNLLGQRLIGAAPLMIGDKWTLADDLGNSALWAEIKKG